MTPRYDPVDPSPQVTPRPDGAVGDGLAPSPGLEPPPRARRRAGRVQFNTQILPALRRLLDDFIDEHDATVQGVVEQALKEYLSARGVDVSSAEEPRRLPRE